MNPVGMGFVAVRKLDRPGQIAGAAVAATVHQAADPAQGVSERDAGREDIGDFPERKVFEPDVKEASDRGADESAVKNQSAAADIENLPERFGGKILAPIRSEERRVGKECRYKCARDQ